MIAAYTDFKMDMGAIGHAGVPAQADDLPLLHTVANTKKHGVHVAVQRLGAIAVVYKQVVSVTGIHAVGNDGAAIGCKDVGVLPSGNINAQMEVAHPYTWAWAVR